ncbi:hypothetical protein CSAL01_09850 [Colletotrichum salicis]|uniref:Major facilitator superfamily (MFS) profile domain-containing protein n=1 Tax=Colletotrichum salicis TaxID=1209931 RepID=A0A135V267_9PEZI|nr:hypothetical protein CSAL01_09850 [Colletotrichum salicis]
MTSNNKESGVFSDDAHVPKDGTISPSTDREEPQISSVSEILQSQSVTRMKAVYREAKQNHISLYLVGLSVLVCAWAYSLDSSTTSYYSIDASSYYKQHSSVLSTLSIATSIISAVSKPFIAKISDITSRPYTYIVTLLFYVIGYVIAASSTSISAYVVGEVFFSVGSSGLDLTNDIIVADLTPLEWRGFVSSLLSAPFIINTWFAGKIVDAMQARNQWRWGYGMFAIIMPATVGPAIATLLYLDREAKDGIVNLASSNAARRAAREMAEEKGYHGPRGAIVAPAAEPAGTWMEGLKRKLIEIDALGLILLGFGWSLLLLPFSLKTYAEYGWSNQSLIAMMVVGGILLIAYVVYEIKWAKVPSAPRRLVMNKTFLMAIVIDSFYMLTGNMRGLYWLSYVYIAKPWSSQDWVYYNNTLTLALSIFGMVAGIMIDGPRATNSTAPIVISLTMVGAGGAFSVVGSRVASQASVPHQEVALAIALLSLWSKIGSSIGSAIVAVIWADKMPKLLREYLPATATDKDVKTLFGSGAIEAYRRTLYYCLVPALALAFVPLIAALFQTNSYLGKQQNSVTNIGNDGRVLKEEEINPEALPPPKNKKEAFLRFWAGHK